MPKDNPQDLYLISDLDTLKVISDPVRFKIFRLINETNQYGENCTAKMLSETMKFPRPNFITIWDSWKREILLRFLIPAA